MLAAKSDTRVTHSQRLKHTHTNTHTLTGTDRQRERERERERDRQREGTHQSITGRRRTCRGQTLKAPHRSPTWTDAHTHTRALTHTHTLTHRHTHTQSHARAQPNTRNHVTRTRRVRVPCVPRRVDDAGTTARASATSARVGARLPTGRRVAGAGRVVASRRAPRRAATEAPERAASIALPARRFRCRAFRSPPTSLRRRFFRHSCIFSRISSSI